MTPPSLSLNLCPLVLFSLFPPLLLCVSLFLLLLWLSGVFPRDKALAHFTHEQTGVGLGCVCVCVYSLCVRIPVLVSACVHVRVYTLMYALKVRGKRVQEQTPTQSFLHLLLLYSFFEAVTSFLHSCLTEGESSLISRLN